MKKRKLNYSVLLKKLSLFVLFSIIGTSVFAQNNNIKLRFHRPLGLELGYERAIKQHQSLIFNVQAAAYDFSGLFDLPNGEMYSANFGIRNYINNTKKLNGLYLEGELGVGKAKSYGSEYQGTKQIPFLFSIIDVPDYARGTAETTVGRLGLNLGYQKRWNVFSVDLGIGAQYVTPIGGDQTIPLDNGKALELPNYVDGITPGAYFGIGFAF